MKTEDQLGLKIREIREEKLGFTQKELAKKLNVTPVYISYLEQGKKAPSEEFLQTLFNISGIDDIPEEIYEILESSKKQIRKKQQFAGYSQDSIYLMQEQGVYNFRTLKSLLENEPDNIFYIYGMLILLLREGKEKEAEQHLLSSLLILKDNSERKWLQAVYHKLEGDFDIAISLMKKANEQFDEDNPKFLQNEKLRQKKSLLLFQTACMYYDFGQHLYQKNEREKVIQNFKIALDYHKSLREIYQFAYYQMDYAGIYFWLALLNEDSKSNYENYILQANEALRLNYQEGINNFPSKKWNSVFSKPYICMTLSFIGRAYGEIALLEKDPLKQDEYLFKGENIFIQSTPLDIHNKSLEYYRFLFNQACFYSVKAELKFNNKDDFKKELELTEKILMESLVSMDNHARLVYSELDSSDGLGFFKKKFPDKVKKILEKLKPFIL